MRYQTLQRMNVLVVMILGIDESLWLLSPGDKHARRELMQTIAVIMAQARREWLILGGNGRNCLFASERCVLKLKGQNLRLTQSSNDM
jgi:hypothetical protein